MNDDQIDFVLEHRGDKIDRLFEFIIKGLLWHHWNVILDRGRHGLWAGFLTPIGVQFHRQFFAMNANARVSANLGEGTFMYEGLQGTDIPEMSVWLFNVYGGMKLSGDPQLAAAAKQQIAQNKMLTHLVVPIEEKKPEPSAIWPLPMVTFK